MKGLLCIAMFVFAILFFPQGALTQSPGEWVRCLDPGGSGQMVSCFVPNQDSRPAYSVINNNSQAQQAPFWESNQRSTSRRSYGGGIDRWTGRPFGYIEYQTETISVRAEANNVVFRPTISISPSYWPMHRY